jgi:hypothetical protein
MQARELGELGVVREELVHAALEIEPALEDVPEDRAPLGREPASRDGDAHECRRRARLPGQALGDCRDDGHALELGAGGSRVHHRGNGMRTVEDHPAGGLPVVRVERLALSEDQVPLFSRHWAAHAPAARSPAPREPDAAGCRRQHSRRLAALMCAVLRAARAPPLPTAPH